MYDAGSWSRISALPTLKAHRRDRRFEALLLASANIVWWTNAAGEFVEEQPYWREYTGQTWEEYRGSRWVSCLHPEDRDAIAEDWKGAVSSGGLISRKAASGRPSTMPTAPSRRAGCR